MPRGDVILQRDPYAGRKLAQLRPANTNAATLYAPITGLVARITGITICNTSGAAVTFRLFHAPDSATYDQTTALFYDFSVPVAAAGVTTCTWPIDLRIYLRNPETLGFQIGTANNLTCTVWGEEISF